MVVVLVVLSVGLAAGLLVATALLRWPTIDPASPRVATRAVAERVASHDRLRTRLARRADPATATGLALGVAMVLAAGGLAAVGALLLMIHTDSGFARWDKSFGQWGADHATAASTTFLRDVSLLGGTTGVITLAVVVALVEFVRLGRRRVVVFLAVVMIGISILLNVVKLIVNRARPDIRRLTGFSGSSFPSGHAATAAAMFAAFALVLGRRRSIRAKAVLAGIAVGVAVSVATTRVLLGVHWFTDVLAGLALGWAWFAVCSMAFGGRLLRFGAPVEAVERLDEAGDATAPPGDRRHSTPQNSG
jgi:undecaprenyl-diphosphatase